MNLLLVPELAAHAWTGHYQVQGERSSADCVLAFSFGYRGRVGRDVTPGISNQDIANLALKLAPKLPKVMQFEVADAYKAAGGSGAVHRIEKHRLQKKYLDTREVAVQAKIVMQEEGYKTALLIAHPHHVPRCVAVCDKLGIDVVVSDDLRGAVEFDPLSSQKWTRNLDEWRGYEPLAIEYYALKGWI